MVSLYSWNPRTFLLSSKCQNMNLVATNTHMKYTIHSLRNTTKLHYCEL